MCRVAHAASVPPSQTRAVDRRGRAVSTRGPLTGRTCLSRGRHGLGCGMLVGPPQSAPADNLEVLSGSLSSEKQAAADSVVHRTLWMCGMFGEFWDAGPWHALHAVSIESDRCAQGLPCRGGELT